MGFGINDALSKGGRNEINYFYLLKDKETAEAFELT
jgi:hypothetical protein